MNFFLALAQWFKPHQIEPLFCPTNCQTNSQFLKKMLLKKTGTVFAYVCCLTSLIFTSQHNENGPL